MQRHLELINELFLSMRMNWVIMLKASLLALGWIDGRIKETVYEMKESANWLVRWWRYSSLLEYAIITIEVFIWLESGGIIFLFTFCFAFVWKVLKNFERGWERVRFIKIFWKLLLNFLYFPILQGELLTNTYWFGNLYKILS